jgi:hypothetical protein
MEGFRKRIKEIKAVNMVLETAYLGFSFYLMFQFIKKPKSIKLQ